MSERKKLLAYVSGPYRDARGTAYVERNIRAAEAVAQELWQMGFAVLCPHSNTRHFDGLVPCEDFLAGDLVMVERCDLVVMLPTWGRSEGAKMEWKHALKVGVPAFFYHRPEDLEDLSQLAGGDASRLAFRRLAQDLFREFVPEAA